MHIYIHEFFNQYCIVGGLESNSIKEFNSESHKEDLDLPFFRLSTLAEATNHFSMSNKLGQGGFGPVYKVIFELFSELYRSLDYPCNVFFFNIIKLLTLVN